ncbi:MAG: hypothetical protein J6B34_04595 [Clostridia bacterium]|nr:hypothetical protein [Clostridia bacterium]
MDNKELMIEFLEMPLNSGDMIFEKFSALPGAIVGKGELPLQRYAYIPGSRSDRVLLVAHADTVWDKDYEKFYSYKPKEHIVLYENGVFFSGDRECGIGADDRAGCAMLWKLRESGHSILVLDGEEDGNRGAWYIKKSCPDLYKELNNHCFMIALDHIRTAHASFEKVNCTKAFKLFIEKETGCKDEKLSGGSDLQVLCDKVCGVNFGVGYQNYHQPGEVLLLSDWEKSYNMLKELLEKPQRKYKTKLSSRVKSFIRGKLRALLKRKK